MARRQDRAGIRMGTVMRAVQADLARPWTVSEMAAVVGVSDAQVRRMSVAARETAPRGDVVQFVEAVQALRGRKISA